MYKPLVVDKIVEKDICTGCGICTAVCNNSSLKMDWNDSGFLVPFEINQCDLNGSCIKVCPFNPSPDDEVKTENEISNIFLNDKGLNYHKRLGKYYSIYAGHSKEFRLTSSSGGLATYVFHKLLENNEVNYLVTVKKSNNDSFEYQYNIICSKHDLLKSSKTRYYPVSLSTVINKIKHLDGFVAISGVSCFVKAIRLLQVEDESMKNKIKFLTGIICGGLKSKYYSDFLASASHKKYQGYSSPEYREKNHNSTAGDYNFNMIDSDSVKRTIAMKTLGDMWGTGLFKCNACDFCEDVSNELCDISLGDAWIEPYINDGKGSSVVITRTILAENIIRQGIENNELVIDSIDEDEFIKSQKGSYTHRQDTISYRLNKNNPFGENIPKRFHINKTPFEIVLVQKYRILTRKLSIDLWIKTKDKDMFFRKMEPYLRKLKKATKLYHRVRSLKNKLKIIK